jgi:peptidoglycan/LPS O-acetylase OafA/YrhL
MFVFFFLLSYLLCFIFRNFRGQRIKTFCGVFLGSVAFEFKNLLFSNILKIYHYLGLILILLICLFFKITADTSLIFIGAYLLFCFALNFKCSFLSSIGKYNDLSYGVYLYAWPVQSLFVQYVPELKSTLISVITIVLVTIISYFSWNFIEKPFLKLKKNF